MDLTPSGEASFAIRPIAFKDTFSLGGCGLLEASLSETSSICTRTFFAPSFRKVILAASRQNEWHTLDASAVDLYRLRYGGNVLIAALLRRHGAYCPVATLSKLIAACAMLG